MRINKISDASSIESYFETMNRFNNKTAGAKGEIAGGVVRALEDVASPSGAKAAVRGFSHLKPDDLGDLAKHFRGKPSLKGLLKALSDGDEAYLRVFHRNFGTPESEALIRKALELGDDGADVLKNPSKHLNEVMGGVKPSPKADTSSAKAPAPKMVDEVIRREDLLAELARHPAGAEVAKSFEVVDILKNDTLSLSHSVNSSTSDVITNLKAGRISPEDASVKQSVSDLTSASKSSSEKFIKLKEIQATIKRLAAGLPSDLAEKVTRHADESIEAAAKEHKNLLDLSAKRIKYIEDETIAAGKRSGKKPSEAIMAAIKEAKTSVAKAVKDAEAGPFKRFFTAAWVATALKTLGFAGVAAGLAGAAYLGYNALTGDADSSSSGGLSGGSAGMSDIGGGSPDKQVPTEDLIKQYLETGDVKALSAILGKTNYTNLMIFPKPIDGIMFAFFDAGRMRSPDERVLIQTHPDTQAVYRTLTIGVGNKVLAYEKSKISSAQMAMNKAVQAIYRYGFYDTSLGEVRANKYIKGRAFKAFPQRGFLGRKAERISPAQRRERTPYLDSAASKRISSLNDLNKVSKNISTSTNNHGNNDITLFKEADDVSKAYCKDAVKDLKSDSKEVREYFAGLGRLYDDKSEKPKTDYKSLYNVNKDSGASLTETAHPKAVVVLDSIGDGGLVENGLEQSQKGQDIAYSFPTGNFRSNYAWVREVMNKKG